MTVSTELSHEEYVGNGVTTDFDFRFRIFEGKHLIVVVADSDGNEKTLKNGTDYTIVGAGSYHGGKVVLNKPLAQGWKILLERDLPVVQETDLRNQGKFFAEVHEDAFDYLTMLIQKALGTFSLSLRKPTYLSNYYDAKGNRIANLAPPRVGGDATNKDYVDNSIKDIDGKTLRVKDKPINALPNTEQRANKILAFDENGQPITVLPESGSASDVLIELSKPTGIKAIGSNHRGNLSLDLTAIDRRPDGYNNDIQAVLDNGNDVEINKDYQSYTQIMLKNGQTVNGMGGRLHISDKDEMTSYQHGFCADKHDPADDINNVVVSGSTTWQGAYGAFGVYLEKSKDSNINGLKTSGFSGAVALRGTDSISVRGVNASKLVRNPKSVRGGYGVFLDETRDTLIDGVLFKATNGLDNHDGRHLLYVSHGGNYHDYNGCVNTICNNVIANYKDKDDRNQWTFNFRKSTRNLLTNFISDGSNNCIAENHERGDIKHNIYANGHIKVIQYENGTGVYGLSQDTINEYITRGWIASNIIAEVKPKDSTITGADCVAFGLSGHHGMLVNAVTNVSSKGMPIMIQPGANNILISNVVDYIDDTDTDEPNAFITFAGSNGTMKNISVRGIRTKRPIFKRITAAIDVDVDFIRKSMITIKNGIVGIDDEYEIINRVAVGDGGISVVIHNHVTQTSCDTCSVRMVPSGGMEGYSIITTTKNKTVGVKFYNVKGELISPKEVIELSFLLFI